MSRAPNIRVVRVLLIDDSPIIRLGLRSALEDYADIEIVAEAGTAEEGVAAVVQHQPDVVLLDLHLPGKSGFHACRELRKLRPQTQVLILTSNSDERNVQEAMNAGAQGYLLKDNDGAALAAGLRAVAMGKAVLDPALAGQLLNLVKHQSGSSTAERFSKLSPQERRLVAFLAGGLTNKQIADQMGLTEKTVKNYLATIFTKLNIERRTQAVALYVESAKPNVQL